MDILRSLLALVTWNTSFEDNPSGNDSPSYGDDEIRLLKTGIRERFEKGHTMNLGSGTVAADGWHKSGSAKLYYQAAEPTTRPDGTTALTADDNGRRWVRSTDRSEYVYVHPSWVPVSILVGGNNVFSGDNDHTGEETFSGGADLGNNGTSIGIKALTGTLNAGGNISVAHGLDVDDILVAIAFVHSITNSNWAAIPWDGDGTSGAYVFYDATNVIITSLTADYNNQGYRIVVIYAI